MNFICSKDISSNINNMFSSYHKYCENVKWTIRKIGGIAFKCIFQYIQIEFKAKNVLSEMGKCILFDIWPYSPHYINQHLIYMGNFYQINKALTNKETINKEANSIKIINLNSNFCQFSNIFCSDCFTYHFSNTSHIPHMYPDKSRDCASTQIQYSNSVKSFQHLNCYRYLYQKKFYKKNNLRNQLKFTMLYRKCINKLHTASKLKAKYYLNNSETKINENIVENIDEYESNYSYDKLNDEFDYVNLLSDEDSDSDDNIIFYHGEYDENNEGDDDILFQDDICVSFQSEYNNCIDIIFQENSTPDFINNAKQVKFSDEIIYIPADISWSEKDQMASRNGSKWLRYSLDRNRFQQRIHNINEQISWIFDKDHRQKTHLLIRKTFASNSLSQGSVS